MLSCHCICNSIAIATGIPNEQNLKMVTVLLGQKWKNRNQEILKNRMNNSTNQEICNTCNGRYLFTAFVVRIKSRSQAQACIINK